MAVVALMYTPVWGGYLLHILFGIKWGSVVATAYMAFWAGPFTPFFPLCIAITFAIKKLLEKAGIWRVKPKNTQEKEPD